MTDPEKASQRPPVKIYPWSRSVTGQFSERELIMLRGFSVADLAEEFDPHPYAIINGVIEITGHGEIRRAVEFARALAELNPLHLERFREVLGEGDMEYWFRKPLEEIPSKPSEMTVPIEYVQ